jgi:drug/metabolite transporter (DMT)-like permease
MSPAAPAGGVGLGRALASVALLALVWGCNWPVLKLGVTHIEPLTFRAWTLPFSGLGLLLVTRLSGHPVRVPRALYGEVALLALFNIAIWNGLVLFGVRELSAGRSSILGYTMPIWATLIAYFLLDEPLTRRRIAGLALGFTGMVVLLGDDLRALQRAPFGALMIVGAAVSWGVGTVLLRRFKPAMPPTAISGWMMIVGSLPLVALAPVLDPHWVSGLPRWPAEAWFALIYNVFIAGTIAHWTWFVLARSLPVAVSSLSTLPIPVVGVISGMLVLGEKPGASEWIALALVVCALAAVLMPDVRRTAPGRGA